MTLSEKQTIDNKAYIVDLASLYAQELVNEVLPFWVKNSPDSVNGGFFTCLDASGKVFDTDKFMWLQGRQVWCLSYMYHHLKPEQQWLDMAIQGADFMLKHGRDNEGNWYFSLDQMGRPLVQPYNIFSDCFATMALAALDRVCPGKGYGEVAVETFDNIIARRQNPKGAYNKNYPGTRPMRNFSLPMILCNLALELEHVIGSDAVNAFIPEVLHEVMDIFYQPELGVILENVAEDGSLVDSFDGRLLNPGHAIEAMWFVMDIGHRIGNKKLIAQATQIMLNTLQKGWDNEYGGIFYFLDLHGHPPQQLEWDQKLWWVHVETLVALAKGYQYTGNQDCLRWFMKVHEYSWQHFRDDKNGGEWYGYLNRQGEVLLHLKGGKWKGCFHVPRALYQIATTFNPRVFNRP